MLTANALRVLEKRYLRRDADGLTIETPEEMFRRVASAVAEPDARLPFVGRRDPSSTAREFREILSSLDFLPNSPTLMNAGRDYPQMSACFVLPVEDSMEGIFDALKHTAMIHKTGGGTGFSFSRLRPKNSQVRSTSGIASGPVSFMKVFNAATEAVKQGGARRGANMGILRVDHPDILEFIHCKRDLAEVTNFNISVAVTDEFMRAVREGSRYRLVSPVAGADAGTLDAREVFEEIVEGAWRCGDPGVVFIDRINEHNPTRHVAEIEATNPCGEQPLMPNEACVLGSIHLGRMVSAGDVDWTRLTRVASAATHFLDNVIEANLYPIPAIEAVTRANRRVGVGVMGWADMLIRLGLPYDSQEAVDLGGRVMAFIDAETKRTSAQLAADRGAFANWPGSSWDREGTPPLRNATTTTVAPTGTISIIAGASSGIEPLFAVSYVRRNVLDDDELFEVHPLFEQIARERGFHSESLMRRVAESGSVQHVDGVPADVKRLFVTAHDIAPYWHVRMQAAFQQHADNGVSKTVNFDAHATRDDVRSVYMLAYEMGCKGVTVFRDGCRDKQVLNVGARAAGAGIPEPPPVLIKIAPRPRPIETSGSTRRVKTGCGNLYVTVNTDEKGPFELFTSMGKSGGCASAQSEAISRLVSLAMRAGVEMESITKHLRGIRCHLPVYDGGEQVLSCPDAIGIALRHAQQRAADGSPAIAVAPRPESMELEPAYAEAPARVASPVAVLTRPGGGLGCPDCGSTLAHEGGCVACYTCGFSRCD
ncbi:MAG TPA: vitamin B12-dependent ribonucleotide reductase [Verrucomicrobiae bacterium]|nr:vitamin B12-dependent ribonucleotide reductase [Verrucomicrobiae bacterium]